MSLLDKQTKLVAAVLCVAWAAGCSHEIVGTKNGNEGVPPTHNQKGVEPAGTEDVIFRGELDCLWAEFSNGANKIIVLRSGAGYTTRLDGNDVVLVQDGVDVVREGDKIGFAGSTSDLPDGFADSSSTCADVGVDFIGYVNTDGVSPSSTEE